MQTLVSVVNEAKPNEKQTENTVEHLAYSITKKPDHIVYNYSQYYFGIH